MKNSRISVSGLRFSGELAYFTSDIYIYIYIYINCERERDFTNLSPGDAESPMQEATKVNQIYEWCLLLR